MPRTHVFSGSIYEEMAGYARAVIVGDAIYVSGTVGVDFATGELADGAEAQTDRALDTIEAALLREDRRWAISSVYAFMHPMQVMLPRFRGD